MIKLLLIVGIMISISGNIYSQIKIEYKTTGSFIWEPCGYLDSIVIEAWGAGGGGGLCYSVAVGSPCCWSGGGGGAGGYCKKKLSLNSDNISSLQWNIPVGTTGNGGSTWIKNGSITILSSSGGLSGASGQFNTFGAGGLGGTNMNCINGCDDLQLGSNGGIGSSSKGGNGGNAPLEPNTGGLGGLQIGNSLGITGENGNSPGGGGGGRGINLNQCISGVTANYPKSKGGDGQIRISYPGFNIAGRIYNDLDLSCTYDSIEMGVGDINFYIPEINFIGSTDNLGYYFVPVLPVGNYTILVNIPNGWNTDCNSVINFTVENSDSVFFLPSTGIHHMNPCVNPEVTAYAPFLRRCFTNQKVYVSACNQNMSTGILNASYVDVELDPLLSVTSATLPFTSLGNNVFRFQTGNINPGECVDFNISTTVSCNAMLGQTLCMDATLYPIESCVLDTVSSNPPSGGGGSTGTLNGFPQPCTLPWDQSSLSVDGWCANDSIYFTITNTGQPGGGDMECYSPMWITVDGVVTYTDSIMIPGGQTITLTFPGDGQTWILNAEQHPLHPGNSHPNAHVEACGDTTNWTPGLVNELPLDDADPVVDIYCEVVTGSFDPNDKTGYPLGQTSERYIQPNQQLQYVIRFQNTGTDTAFTVVIRDTLDTDLNIFTVTPGVSSHDYSFQMYGPRVLEWTFNNINLPDSTTDLEGSNGFVTFHVEQVPDLAPGTLITNDADIYFDFNDPITTNTTVHRIYEGFISVAELEALSQEKSAIKVYPNPTTGNLSIQTESLKTAPYLIYNQLGTLVEKGSLNGNQTHLELNLNSGVYFLQIDNEVVKFSIIK